MPAGCAQAIPSLHVIPLRQLYEDLTLVTTWLAHYRSQCPGLWEPHQRKLQPGKTGTCTPRTHGSTAWSISVLLQVCAAAS